MKRTLCGVGLAALCLTWAASARAQVPDHLKCYKVKDAIKLSGTLSLTSAQFGLEAGCKISSTALFCVAASKSNVSVTNKVTGMPITPLPFSAAGAGDDRVCYKIKCPTPATPIPTQSVTDQFGNRMVSSFKASLLCTPAVTGTGFCGNGTIDAGEQCDGANLGGATCQSVGFGSGTLACGPGCTFDTSGCSCTGAECSPAKLPATGQTTCWDSSGNVIACAGTGHDGDIQAGAALTYTDNGDGTITDDNTGLQWEKQSSDGSVHDMSNTYTWDQAFSGHVATLNTMSFAGHTDWRVPNVRELQSIVNYQNSIPAVSPAFNTSCTASCTVLTCSCTASNFYWSSSSYAGNPTVAWNVVFNGGFSGALGTSDYVAVRGVRGGS